ncbi:MAG: choice-of-anchor U domain-containing protein, partial [Desulfobacterales bacterium]
RQPDVILAANTADGSGSKQIGISPVGTEVVVESLEAVAASTIGDTANRPTDFPFGLINYRLKVNSADGIARVTVYLSEAAPAGAKWYKYDTFKGWIDYSDHAEFSVDRRSVTIELKDGDYGDLDRIVNGEITDPGGVGVTTSATPPPATSGGGGGGGCFIDSASPGTMHHNHHFSYLLFLATLCCGIVIFVRLRRG